MLLCLVIYCVNHVNFDIEWQNIQVTDVWEIAQLAFLCVLYICISIFL